MRIEPRRQKLVFGAVWLSAALISACASRDLGRGARTTNTSGYVPRPETTAASLRTIDNAGFVDNGGRTSDMTSRTEASGMRATEAGSERITGTPGSGFAPPGGRAGEPNGSENAPIALPSGKSSSSPGEAIGQRSEQVARIARAECDRETSCNRVGAGGAWPTQNACMVQAREQAHAELGGAACARGIQEGKLGACLNRLRGQACDVPRRSLDDVPECRPSVLCVR